jgi:hypothetical protein
MTLQLAEKKGEKTFTYDLIGSNLMMVYALGKISVVTKEETEITPGVFGHLVVTAIQAPEMTYEQFKEYGNKTLLANILVKGGMAQNFSPQQ